MKSCINWFKEVLLLGAFLIFSAFVVPTHISRATPTYSSDLNLSQCKQTIGNSEERIVVSYDQPFDYILDTSVSWQILHTDTKILYKEGLGHLKGVEFSKPGNYTLHIRERNEHSETECAHLHFPDKILIEVRPFKMVFDFTTVKLSKDLKGNQSVNGTTLTVDVVFSSWENTTAIYEGVLTTSGVRTSIIGTLKNESVLIQQGKNTLEFQLEGQASNNTYISIDFTDINGQIQSYSFTNKII